MNRNKRMTGFPLTRRTVLATLPASVVVSQLTSIRWAVAQDEGQFREQLQVSRDIAITLANDVREVPGEIDSNQALEWQALDYQGRNALAVASSGLSQDQLYQFFPDEFRAMAGTMIAQGIPLIPAPRDIVPLSTVRVSMGESCPPIGEVMWDILFDSLGLLDERDLLFAAVNAKDGTNNYIERMNGSIIENQRGRAIDAVF